jgi:glutathionylspermidine synthase
MKFPWHIVEPLSARTFAEIRRAAIFECCKWDPQIEDVCALSPQPLVLTAEAWSELTALAEQLARETAAAEQGILRESACLRELGLPWRLRRGLSSLPNESGRARHARFMRFDFHYTTEGWRISEVNCDVPGGFNEASGFSRIIAQHYSGVALPGDPTQALAALILKTVGRHGTVALVHATAYTDDRQAMVYLSRRLESVGLKPVLIGPDHLRWENAEPFLATDWAEGPVNFIFRFFPAEWLPSLPRRCEWWHLLGSSRAGLCNPGSTIVCQSKRFPLIWSRLTQPLPAWTSLLPPTYDPRRANSRFANDDYVLKPALGRVGDGIGLRGVTPAKEAQSIRRSARLFPRGWAAQQRFEAVPFRGVAGDVYPCIGVYTLNGEVVGAYGRVGRVPLINHLAQDAAVLIADPASAPVRSQPIFHESNRTLQTVDA